MGLGKSERIMPVIEVWRKRPMRRDKRSRRRWTKRRRKVEQEPPNRCRCSTQDWVDNK